MIAYSDKAQHIYQICGFLAANCPPFANPSGTHGHCMLQFVLLEKFPCPPQSTEVNGYFVSVHHGSR